MKRICLITIILLATLVACRKESDTVTLGATIENIEGNPKLYIDNTLTPQWENNDPVWINGNDSYSVTISNNVAQIVNVARAENNHYLAIYPADIVAVGQQAGNNSVTVNLPREQVYQSSQQVKVPMIAYTEGNTLGFKNLCSLLKVTVENSTDDAIALSRITLTASTAMLSGPVTASILNGEGHLDSWGAEAEHDISLCFPTAQPLQSEGRINCYIAVPEFAANEVSIIVYTNDGRFFPILKNSVPLSHNRIATITVDIDQLLECHENFTVGADNHTVRFSKGNLQYTTTPGNHTTADNNYTTGQWRFAKHQYDIIGTANTNISSTYAGWIDLFGWATSGYNGYAPTLSYTNASQYYALKNISGRYYDWGKYNAIGNDNPGTWRTLQETEWQYLLNTRNGVTIGGTSSVKFAQTIVNGRKGVMLFPDGFTWPSTIQSVPSVFNTNQINWNNTDYTLAQWAILEASGVVFLPAAGYRLGTNVNEVNLSACYWTSTLYSSSACVARFVKFFGGGTPFICGTTEVSYGLSVRLVKDNTID